MNERTSKRGARIAAKILAMKPDHPHARCFALWNQITVWEDFCAWSDIRALAAFCHTQTADKAKRKKSRRSYVALSPRPSPRAKRKGGRT